MSFFQNRFPYHALLFQDNVAFERNTSRNIKLQDHLIVLGPIDEISISEINKVILKKPNVRIFWITNAGDKEAIVKNDLFFNHPHLYLYDYDEPEILAYQMAENATNLSFELVNYLESIEGSKDYLKKIAEHFVILFYIRIETIHLPKVFGQIISNLKSKKPWLSLNQAKDVFKNKPLLIAGAGPSLDDYLEDIKKHQHSWNLMTAGTSIAIFSDHGMTSDFSAQVCPNDESFNRLQDKIKSPFVFTAPRCHRDIFSTHLGQNIVLPMISAVGFDELKQSLGSCSILDEMPAKSTTVILFAVKIAEYLGFSPIILAGVDLYHQGKSYAGNIQTDDPETRFLPEIHSLEELIATSPSKFYRLGSESHFKNVSPLSIDELKALFDQEEKLDFSLLTNKLEETTFSKEDYLKRLKASFKRIQEKWNLPLRDVHIEDELGYREYLKFCDNQDEALKVALDFCS